MLQEFKTLIYANNLELCLVHSMSEESKSVNYLPPQPVTHSLNK